MLTSGGATTAEAGTVRLTALVQHAGWQIEVLPAGVFARRTSPDLVRRRGAIGFTPPARGREGPAFREAHAAGGGYGPPVGNEFAPRSRASAHQLDRLVESPILTGMPPDDVSLDAFVDTLRRSRLFDPADLSRLAARCTFHFRARVRRVARSPRRTPALPGRPNCSAGGGRGWSSARTSILAPLGRGDGNGRVPARDRRVSESLGDTDLVAPKVLPDRKAVEEPKTLARFRRRWNSAAG